MRYFSSAAHLLLAVLLAGCATFAGQATPEAVKRLSAEARQEGLPVIVTRVNPGPPNSAGGVNLVVHWVNLSPKTVKYAYITATPVNAVGDAVRDEISRESVFTGQVTGPVETDRYEESVWRNAWYNSTISCLNIDGFRIEYMDGSANEMTQEDIQRAIVDAKYRPFSDGLCGR